MKSVLPILLLAIWLLKTIFIPVGSPYFGSDAYIEKAATLEIARFGWIGLDPWLRGLSQWVNSTNYPLLSAISISLTKAIGYPIDSWTRWAMPIISLLSVCLVYSISIEIYKSKRVALLGSLGFGLTYMYLMFHSLFLREAIAFPFFLATIYAYIRSRSGGSVRSPTFYTVSALICGIAVVFTHHLTSVLLLFIGLIFILISRLPEKPVGLNFGKLLNFTGKEKYSITFWIFITVALLTFWIYLHKSPISIVSTMIEDFASGVPSNTFTLPSTNRYHFVLYNQVITTLSFAVLAIFGLFASNKQGNRLQLVAVVWSGFCGFCSVIFAVAGIPGVGSTASRFELFGYAFLIPAAALGAIYLTQKRKWLIVPVAFLFVYYGLNSVYRFPPYLYSNVRPSFLKQELRQILLPEEYNLLTKIDTKSKIASDSTLTRLVRPISGSPAFDWFNGAGRGALPVSAGFDYLILGERQLSLFSAGYYGKSLEDTGMSRIYSSGQSAIFVPGLNAEGEFNIEDILGSSPPESGKIDGLNWIAWLALFLEFGLVCLAGLSVIYNSSSFRAEDFALGVMLIFFGIFIIYLISNLIGFSSPGYTVLLFLLAISIGSLAYRKRYRSINAYSIMPWVLICAMIIGFGFIIDPLSQRVNSHPYSEFYVEKIASCPDGTCISLNLTNHEAQRVSYRIEGIDNSITLEPEKSWQGMLKVLPMTDKTITIGLNKLPASQTTERLFLQFKN